MRRSSFICVVLLVLSVCSGVYGSATPKHATPKHATPKQVMLNHRIDTPFPPERAWVVYFSGEKASAAPAALARVQANAPDEKEQWLIGAVVMVEDSQDLVRYSIVAQGSGGKFVFVPSLVEEVPVHLNFREALSELPKILAQRNEVLKSWVIQKGAQDASLRRLRADADVIANVGRIVEVLEEVESAKREIGNLERDILILNEYFRLSKARPAPKNFTRRELELTKQVSELAMAAKNIELGEFQRKSQFQDDISRKLELIEATRLDEEEALAKELQDLSQRRQVLEERTKGRPVTSADYWEAE